MGRHEQREQLFKLLFRVEFNSLEDMPEQIKLFFQDEETEYTQKAVDAISEKYEKIQEKLPEIDKLLDENSKDKNTLALLKYMSEEDKEEKLLENQQMLKTPIVRNGRQATVGYQPEVWKNWE